MDTSLERDQTADYIKAVNRSASVLDVLRVRYLSYPEWPNGVR